MFGFNFFGWFSRIFSSLWIAALGFFIVVVSLIGLFSSENRTDIVRLVSKAPVVSALENYTGTSGDLVVLEGVTALSNEYGDEYVEPASYIALNRFVETYAWQEEQKTINNQSVQEYSYTQKWLSQVPDSQNFKEAVGHENIQPSISSSTYTASEFSLGNYTVSTEDLDLPSPAVLSLDSSLRVGFVPWTVENDYLYIRSGSQTDPRIGDMRIRYRALSAGDAAVLVGALNENNTVTAFGKERRSIFRLFDLKNKEEVVRRLSQEETAATWFLRVALFALVWLGVFMSLSPLRAVSSIVGFFGSIARAGTLLVSFVVAFIFALLTVSAALVFSSIWSFLVTVAVLVIVCALFLWYRSRKTGESIVE